MGLNHTTLASGLATIFGVPQQFVVLRQGTWFNIQDYLANPSKPDTWVSFRIKNAKPRCLPFQMANYADALNPYDVVYYTSDVDLQIVGAQAQMLAESVGHWLDRSDVQTVFANIDAQVMGCQGDYTITDFYQGGAEYTNRSNTVLSYNTRFKVEWASAILVYSSDSIIVTSASVSGTMLVASY
jgi:phospholipase/lecithinase/hemolysin